jgi:hypothetical protein
MKFLDRICTCGHFKFLHDAGLSSTYGCQHCPENQQTGKNLCERYEVLDNFNTIKWHNKFRFLQWLKQRVVLYPIHNPGETFMLAAVTFVIGLLAIGLPIAAMHDANHKAMELRTHTFKCYAGSTLIYDGPATSYSIDSGVLTLHNGGQQYLCSSFAETETK